MCPKICPGFRAEGRKSLRCLEAPVGIEPTNRGFADLCLTTWLRRRRKRNLAIHCGFGKGWTSTKQRVDSCAQHRHEPPLKPGMMLEPRLITRRGVGQRQVARRILRPSPDCCSQRWLAAAAQKVALGILPDEQSQFNPGQLGQQLVEP